MTLNGSLYKISSHDGGNFALLMLAGHPVYEGHFPGEPVTPGVLTLAMVRECASELAGNWLQYKAIKSCRFAATIRPGDSLILNIDMTNDGRMYQLKAEINDQDGNLRLTLEATLESVAGHAV